MRKENEDGQCFPFPCMTYNISKDTDQQRISTLFIKSHIYIHEGWNFNSGNYLFTTDTK